MIEGMVPSIGKPEGSSIARLASQFFESDSVSLSGYRQTCRDCSRFQSQNNAYSTLRESGIGERRMAYLQGRAEQGEADAAQRRRSNTHIDLIIHPFANIPPSFTFGPSVNYYRSFQGTYHRLSLEYTS